MLKKVIRLFFLLTIISSSLFATGLTVYEQGAKSVGMAGAFVASADDPSAVFFNAAAITNVPGIQVMLGASQINYTAGFSGPEQADSKKYTKAKETDLLPAHLYVTYNINKWFSAGLGVCSPFAKKTDWTGDINSWAGRDIVLVSKLNSIYYNPVFAVNLFDYASVALGVSYVQADLWHERSVYFVPRHFYGHSVLDASGSGYGFNFAVQAQPIKGLRLGAAYQSAVELDINDASTAFSTDEAESITLSNEFHAFYPEEVKTKVNTKLPYLFSAGISYDFTSNMTFEIAGRLNGYEKLDVIEINYSEEVNRETTDELVQNYKNSLSLHFGFEYHVDEALAVRVGYFWDQNTAPEKYVEPSLVDGESHNYALGLGYKIAGFSADGFCSVALMDDRTVTGTYYNFDGTYYGVNTLYGLSLGYSF